MGASLADLSVARAARGVLSFAAASAELLQRINQQDFDAARVRGHRCV
ncbi:hypothetical protein [Arthrobacter sp. R4-81]